ncbi:MAG: hypothetical protein RH946_08345 [Rhodospirillales bacterium]
MQTFHKRIRTLHVLMFSCALTILNPGVPKATADVFDNLMAEPVTMLDFGIKRLRSAALQTSLRLVAPSDPKPQSQVFFDQEKREIRLNYVLAMRQEGISMTTCWERRLTAIREVFYIGSTSYAVPISAEQRVMRRLGAMFTREPIEKTNAAQAMGERLAESTFVRMSIAVPSAGDPIVCEGRVSDLRTK